MAAPDPDTDPTAAGEPLADLRSRAAFHLSGGTAARGSKARAVDALSVLHALASSSATAADALTLLHELQVHQVELDLQAQELQESRAELESALRRQVELHDLQPAACFAIDARLVLHELNRSGADMLGIPRDDARGLSLDTFVGADSAQRLKSALAGVDASRHKTSCRLQLCPLGGPARPIVASIGADSTANRYLVCCLDAADEAEPPAPG